MQFYRKWIPMQEDTSGIQNNKQLTFFKKLGFVHLDGSEIDVNGSLQQNIRWRYDNYQTTSRKFASWTWGGSTDHSRGIWYWRRSDGNTLNLTDGWNQGNKSMMAWIGFPLKNRGVFFQTYVTNQDSWYNYPPQIKYWAQNTTPGWAGAHYTMNLLCIYNNLMNEFNYGQCIYWGDRIDYFYLDFNYQQYYSFICDSSNDYTDGKNNICTLIKYPTNLGYIDNLYLISTTPKNITNTATALQGKFFSFGGRNFYCPRYNLAVELPAN